LRPRDEEADGGRSAAPDGQAATAERGSVGVREIPLARQSRAEPQRARHWVIVVDSSVWIDFLNGRKAAHVERLHAALGAEEIVVGDLMLCEVLQGLASERAAREVESLLRRFAIVPMAGDAIAVAAARNFRYLRRRGITVRKTIDMLIATWCIENRVPLLHNDSDFHIVARHLGLIELPLPR
jgi:predicted nucleic acid-binding protein